MKHIVTDLETLSTASNALILTIGACEFDIETGTIGETFYRRLQIHDGTRLGFHISNSTLEWWERQSKEAYAAAFSDEGTEPVSAVLADFAKWVIHIREKDPKLELSMWANDPDFDMVILRNACEKVDILPPWQYFEHRSQRTMLFVGEKYGFNRKKSFPRSGTHHNALDDAIHQSKVISTIWQKIG